MDTRYRPIAYVPRPHSSVARVIEALRSHPAGTRLRTGELAMQAGVSVENFVILTARGVEAGLLLKHERVFGQGGGYVWSVPTDFAAVVEPAQPELETRPTGPHIASAFEHENWRQVQIEQREPSTLVGTLRDLVATGDHATTGDPLRSLSDAIAAARQVLAAKSVPGCRFQGAEVDQMVARELRQISEAAERAKTNLMQALEVM